MTRRVLMTTDAVGGVWRYALDLSDALRDHGTATMLAVLGPPPSDAQRAEAQRCCERVEALTCRLEWMESPWQDVQRSGEWLLALAQAWAPDVVHLNGYSHAALPWQAPAIVVAHSCVCSWWRAVHQQPAPASWDRYRRRVAAGLERAHAVVAPSFAMRDALELEYRPRGLARVIPNGRRGPDLSDGAQPPKEPYVFSAGRLWDPAKNVRALCDAAVSLPWGVAVAGDAVHAGQAVRDLGPVRPLGVLSPPEVQAHMARASIYALPARYEPFGLSVLEAAASGCALVLGDIQSLRENWEGAAVFVDPDDSTALAGELQRLIADASRRRSLGEQARERSRHFTAARMAAAYQTLYDGARAAESLSAVRS